MLLAEFRSGLQGLHGFLDRVAEGGFGALDALEAPLGGGDLADEDFIHGVGGLEVGADGVVEGFEIFEGIAGDDGEAGSDAVLERVQGGTGARSGSG